MTLNEVKTIINNIDDFIEIPEGISQLRQAVVSLGVSGKLVPQDKKDNTVEELYNKGTKKVSEIALEEIPFEIPKSWKWIRLIDIAEIYNGDSINKQIKESKYSNIDNGYPYIATKDINRESHFIDYLNGIKIPYNEKNFKIAPKDSVLICSEGGNAGRKIGILSEEVCFGNKLITTIPNNKINSKFIFFTFLADYFQNSFQSKVNGLIGGISISNFKYLPIAIPPLAEQKRIVKKIEEVMKQLDDLEIKKQKSDETRTRLASSAMQSLGKGESKIAFDNLTELIKTADDIKELEGALLSLALSGKLVSQDKKDGTAEDLYNKIQEEKIKFNVGKKQKLITPISEEEIPFEIPKSWKWVYFDDVFDVRDGTHDSPKYLEKGYPLVTSKNLYYGKLDFLNVKYISKEDYIKINERSCVEKNDVLFAMIGSIGNPVIVDTDTKFGIKNVALFKYYSPSLSEPHFLNMYLKYTTERMKEKSAGAVQSFVSLGFLRKYPFPLPPLPEQKRIVQKVEEIMILISKLKEIIGENKSQGRGRPKK